MLLDEVRKMERGSTLQPIAIIHLVLQFFNAVFIRGDYFRLPSLIYFISWLSVESLLLLVHGDKVE